MDATASALARYVMSLNLAAGQRIDWTRRRQADDPLLDEVFCLHILGVENQEIVLWTAPRAAWVVPMTSDLLQARVDEKAAKLESYRDTVSENWLVIVSEGNKTSQFFDVGSELNPPAVVSPFARTYFFDRMKGAVIGLGTIHQT